MTTCKWLAKSKSLHSLTISVRFIYRRPRRGLTGFFANAIQRTTDILESQSSFKKLTIQLHYADFYRFSSHVVYNKASVAKACSRLEQFILSTPLEYILFSVRGGQRRRDIFWKNTLDELFPALRKGNRMAVHCTADDEVELEYGHDLPVSALAVSPDNRWIASGAKDGCVILWCNMDDTIRAVRDWRAQSDIIDHLQFAPDSLRLSSNGWYGNVKVWDVVRGVRLARWSVGQMMMSPSLSTVWSPDRRLLAYHSGEEGINLRDAQTYEKLLLMDSVTGFREPTCSIFSPDGWYIATGNVSEVVVDDCSTFQRLAVLHSPRPLLGKALTAAFSVDDNHYWLTVVWSSGELTVWNFMSTKANPHAGHILLRPISGRQDLKESILTALSPDGTKLLWVPKDATHVHIFDTASGALSVSLIHHDHLFVLNACFSPCSGYVATAGDDRCVRLWRTSTGECLATFECGRGAPTHIAFTPNGRNLVAGTRAGSVYVHRVADLMQMDRV
ncbi:quinon protein alcohol dehydrogenase-like superfamily [Earliella scabrosa]|nr:quinon protein alcohol dehydrogenase-like superfamily [Earliella scabrosa]